MTDRRPAGWVKAAFRLPAKLFQWGLGWLFGGRLLLVHHLGRRSGTQYQTVLEVVARRERPAVWYVAAAWGQRADWLQNLRAHPDTTLMVGRRVVPVVADVLDLEQAAAVYADYQRHHPVTASVIGRLIGVDVRNDPPVRLATRMPVVALRSLQTAATPAATARGGTAGVAAVRDGGGSVPVARVTTTRAQTRATYDRIAPVYQLLEGLWERTAIMRGRAALDVRAGEAVLDVGCGPGVALAHLARAVSPAGHAVGVDLSPAMCRVARRRIERGSLATAASVVQSDACRLPFTAAAFDACFVSFTLELFDTPEIPDVLSEVRRVLRAGGRVAVVALTKAGPDSRARRSYEWGHERLPRFLDCRPIYPAASLVQAGLDIMTSERLSLWGLPVDVIVAVNPRGVAEPA